MADLCGGNFRYYTGYKIPNSDNSFGSVYQLISHKSTFFHKRNPAVLRWIQTTSLPGLKTSTRPREGSFLHLLTLTTGHKSGSSGDHKIRFREVAATTVMRRSKWTREGRGKSVDPSSSDRTNICRRLQTTAAPATRGPLNKTDDPVTIANGLQTLQVPISLRYTL